jgi:hypothetical protein
VNPVETVLVALFDTKLIKALEDLDFALSNDGRAHICRTLVDLAAALVIKSKSGDQPPVDDMMKMIAEISSRFIMMAIEVVAPGDLAKAFADNPALEAEFKKIVTG